MSDTTKDLCNSCLATLALAEEVVQVLHRLSDHTARPLNHAEAVLLIYAFSEMELALQSRVSALRVLSVALDTFNDPTVSPST